MPAWAWGSFAANSATRSATSDAAAEQAEFGLLVVGAQKTFQGFEKAKAGNMRAAGPAQRNATSRNRSASNRPELGFCFNSFLTQANDFMT
jgi:hypothetical protein